MKFRPKYYPHQFVGRAAENLRETVGLGLRRYFPTHTVSIQ
jgi:hypothetical protein